MHMVTQPKTRYLPEYPFSSQIQLINLSPEFTLNLSTSFLTATTYLSDSFFLVRKLCSSWEALL